MDEKELYAIDWENYLKPDRKRQSGTHASVGWDSRNQFESDFGRVFFVLPSEGCMIKLK